MRSMKQPVHSLIALLVLLSACIAFSQQNTPAPLTNDSIVKMVKGGLAEPTIVSAIEASDVQFDVSADGLIALKQAGISDTVIQAMIAAQSKKHDAAASPDAAAQNTQASSATSPNPQDAVADQMAAMGMTPQMMSRMPASARAQVAMMSQMGGMGGMSGMMGMNGLGMNGMGMGPMLSPDQMPKVLLENGSEKRAMASSMAQIAQSSSKGGPKTGMGAGSMLSSLATQALSFAAIGAGPGAAMAMPALGMATGMMGMFGNRGGMPTYTYVWALPGYNSPVAMPATMPKFDLQFGEIVGLDPDSYEPVIVNLKQTKDNWRLVGATKAKMDYMGGGGNSESMLDEIRVPAQISHLGRGHVEIAVTSALAPGEYGVVLRPSASHKHKKGQSLSGAEQSLFYSVWDFSVPSAEKAAPSTVKK